MASLETMETMVDASHRLMRTGYDDHWSAGPGGRLRCNRTRRHYEAAEVTVDEIVRFEGCSDPADQAVLYALTGPDGNSRGLYIAAYGPDATSDDAEVAQRLH